jgi:hypothetical protein
MQEHAQQQQQVLLAAGSDQAQRGVLQARLWRLQGMEWRRMHVVWPRLCLGNSHCNIQVGRLFLYMYLFVDTAVVAGTLMTHQCMQ